MSDPVVTYEQSDDIVKISMDDGKANALSYQMLDELDAAFDRAEADGKAVVLAGREGKFCAGFDLKEMMKGPAAAGALVTRGGQLLLRLYEIGLPVVVACTGHALAGGVLLAATGDWRIGSLGSFKLGLNEVHNGMPVPILAHELARDHLLPTELLASVVHAKIYDPEGAVRAGWLDAAVAPAELLATATSEAKRLGALPRMAYSASKRSLRRQTIAYIKGSLESNVAELLGPGAS
ncbi:MAG: crotonase/enoyl-CoA hydratase family protein [Deltaproteobacteria bacterium]|nr:crotonase/enoyl-CoA hydratase family protein [Deltaproteobacteria bacterium]